MKLVSAVMEVNKMPRVSNTQLERWASLAALVLVVLIAATSIFRTVTNLPENWPYISGWEYEWIADALARGEGFSFPGNSRWLFDPTDPNDRTEPGEYYATAWEEPIYPLLLAACFRIFGNGDRVVMLAVHLLCFLATLGLVYQIGKRLDGPAVGLAAVVILAVIPLSLHTVSSSLVNSAPAGMLVAMCALLTLWALRNLSVKRALALGGVIGISALTHAATMVFAPVAAFVLLIYGRPRSANVWWASLAVVFAAALVISPWTVRNYLTFGEFVPVKTGLGAITELANVSLAHTFNRVSVADAEVELPWTASDPVEAWSSLAYDTKKRLELYRYSLDSTKSSTPGGFINLNEAERDRIHLNRTISFILDNPVTTMKLILIKVSDFYFFTFRSLVLPDRAGMVAVLAVVGFLIAFKVRKVQILALFILAYSAPYVVTGPFFYRYRYPIEPLMAVLAGVGTLWLAKRTVTHLHRRSAPNE
jgi:Dolichyl-phosphate-mannose-protein mannosyltransferase